MALMIPDDMPSKSPKGEQFLFQVMRDRLPDDFIVWHEPTVNNYYPDFIILGPDFGLLILEVKGWYASQVEEANNTSFQVRWTRGDCTKSETSPNPLHQGKGYFEQVRSQFLGYPILCNPEGDYKGNLCFPVGVGAVMSNMTEAQARHRHLYRLLEKPAVVYRDELLSWKDDLTRDDLIHRLKAMFKVSFSLPRLTNGQVSTIKGILHPEVVIKEVPATQTSLPIEVETPIPPLSKVLLTLDSEQEKLARTMKEGHRLISGVAGSGKTSILLARAKILANRLTQARILILCFNKILAAELRSQLHGDTRNPHYREWIEVMHFHAWAKALLGSLPNPNKFNDDQDEDYNQLLGQQLLEKLQTFPLQQRWDSVLVDEAHTFSKSWFPCCVAALKDPLEGNLLIVSDINQALYKRKEFTWKEVGVKAPGRSLIFRYNYRNTQEILTAAWSVVQSFQGNGGDTFPAIKPIAALRRHGQPPKLHLASSEDSAVKATIEQVTTLCKSGYSAADIAILYRRQRYKEDPVFPAMIDQLKTLGIPTYWITATDETKRTYDVNLPGVRIVTALSSLGLEFKAVLLLWVEQFDDCNSQNENKAALARRQLYVAMTRAQDELYLFAGKKTRLVEDLGKVMKVEYAKSETG